MCFYRLLEYKLQKTYKKSAATVVLPALSDMTYEIICSILLSLLLLLQEPKTYGLLLTYGTITAKSIPYF